jgi:hypothetical protein
MNMYNPDKSLYNFYFLIKLTKLFLIRNTVLKFIILKNVFSKAMNYNFIFKLFYICKFL